MIVLVLPKDIKQQVLTFLYLSYNHMQMHPEAQQQVIG